MDNPFITSSYIGPEYFCDRKKETEAVVNLLGAGNNLAIISPRRMGKTDLIRHCFQQESIRSRYHTFIVDIYSATSLKDMTARLGRTILETLKPKGKKAWSSFLDVVSSLKAGISYDAAGVPSWSMEIGEVKTPETTLDEIFSYLSKADKECIVAIDEFQQILNFPEKNVEALLRTHIQYCSNARFIFSGSHREMMGGIFTTAARPFYQSVSIINLPPISEEAYCEFCLEKFKEWGKDLHPDVPHAMYGRFESVTLYMQRMMNTLFMLTPQGGICTIDDIPAALDYILTFSGPTYEDLLYQLPEKQRNVLLAIAREGKASKVMSSSFVKRHGLTPSSVQSGLKGLMEKRIVTSTRGTYYAYDLFLAEWIRAYYDRL